MNEAMQIAQVQGAPPLPQVNLLPPSVRAKRKVAFVRVWLALALLIVVFFTIVACVIVLWAKQSVLSDLADIQATNDSLQHEQAKYAKAPKVLKELKAREDARTQAMSTEILWKPYMEAIASATPTDAQVETLTIAEDTVWGAGQVPGYGPLDTPGTVGQVSIGGRATTLAVVSDWQDALSKLKGVADVQFASIELADDQGNVYYGVSATFKLTADAFANQYVMEQ